MHLIRKDERFKVEKAAKRKEPHTKKSLKVAGMV